MGYYTQRHAYFCGIDLHARSMFVTIQDASGETLVHQNVRCSSERLAALLKPYRDDVVVACECTFSWYWLCDWCAEHNIPFALGHALAMRAIHRKNRNSSPSSSLPPPHLQKSNIVVGASNTSYFCGFCRSP